MSLGQPVTHALNRLPDVDSINPLSGADLACLREVRKVLEKHERLERFGVMLLHKHFDLEADEILLENTNVSDRVQTIRPVKTAALASEGEILETSWSLQAGETMMACKKACVKELGRHTWEHVKSGS